MTYTVYGQVRSSQIKSQFSALCLGSLGFESHPTNQLDQSSWLFHLVWKMQWYPHFLKTGNGHFFPGPVYFSLSSLILRFEYIQGDQTVSVHMMNTVQKVTNIVQSVSRQSPDIYCRLTLTPSVIHNSNYAIMVSNWNCLKYFCWFFWYYNHQVHRDVWSPCTIYATEKCR
jgi:hypothetical protein